MSDLNGAGVDFHPLAVAFGRKNLGIVKNKTLTWGELVEKLSEPAIGNETLKEYLALPRKTQDEIKNVGFFIGAHCDDGKRKATAIHKRSLVTFDIDEGTPALLDNLEVGLSDLCKYEFFIYSTRKHTAAKPRVRVVIPLAEPVDAEAYEATARILASQLDTTVTASMDAVDDVSFRLAQMMFLPSHCRGADWFTLHNRGRLAVAEEVLEAFGDWQDHSKLPFSEKQGQKRLADPKKKAEDPTEKAGIIGAFCRVFDVPAAIDAFLPDVYTPGDEESGKPRYTFVGGSTSNGAIVEDDGLFLYSYHTTDPCSDRLVNSWDLVRIHKFGDLDEDAKEGTSPGNMPSFKAMVEFAEAIDGVKQELAEAQYDLVAMFEDFGDDVDDLVGGAEEEREAAKKDKEWVRQLELTEKGQIKNTLANITQILINDPRFKGTMQFNEFTQEVVTRKPMRSKIEYLPPSFVRDPVNGDLWQDSHDRNVRVVLESAHGKGKPGYGLKVSDRDVTAAVDIAARNNCFHPVKEYFSRLEWDGTPRLERLFIDYLGCEDNAYYRHVAVNMMVAATTRIYEPGHKFDSMVIVEGLQGKRKSTFFQVLGRHWFAEMEEGFDDPKKAVETMHGALIIEVAELSQFTRSEVTQIKAFVSRQAEKVRMSYERREKVFPRQCVLSGTTNERAYLRDTTGNRRFLPVECMLPEGVEIDTDRLEQEVDQLWAEAVATYRGMRERQPHGVLPLFLRDEEAKAAAKILQESRRIETDEDAMIGQIEAWLDTPVEQGFIDRAPGVAKKFDDLDDLVGDSRVLRNVACGIEIWVECFGGTIESYSRGAQVKLARAMQRLEGWTQCGLEYTKKHGRQRVIRRKGKAPHTP